MLGGGAQVHTRPWAPHWHNQALAILPKNLLFKYMVVARSLNDQQNFALNIIDSFLNSKIKQTSSMCTRVHNNCTRIPNFITLLVIVTTQYI